MNTSSSVAMPQASPFAPAIEIAVRAIAPAWPLDRQIAVSPYWGFIDLSFEEAAATLDRLAGSPFTLPPGEYLRAWGAGEIDRTALEHALAEAGTPVTLDDAVAALQLAHTRSAGLPLLSDIIDQRTAPAAAPRWRDTITQQVSQYCASYFDEHQADWHRGRGTGLFAGWRGGVASDHALEPLMHAPEIRARVGELPADADAAIAWSLERLHVLPGEAADFLRVCLLRINGWASWCAYLGWEAGLARAVDPHLRELLAIRVSWEALLHPGRWDAGSHGSRWRESWARARRAEPLPSEALQWVWQRAQEIGYQQRLIGLLGSSATPGATPPHGSRPAAQLVFCIDVRSERFRRALESADPAVETRGFAGFFGLPIRYTPLGTHWSRPQLPGLLAPQLEVEDSTGNPPDDAAIAKRRMNRLERRARWMRFLRLPSGAFSFVETIGVGYAAAILRRHFGTRAPLPASFGLAARDTRALRPQLRPADGDSVRAQADLVASILRTMGLTTGFARLLVLVGHGCESANNPQAAALDCGACGGQSGEINARVLAALLNDRSIRLELGRRGIDIPEDTIAVGALHNTTTDDVALFDLQRLPVSHLPDLERLQRSLLQAGHGTRRERAPSLGLARLVSRPDALHERLRRRARDWAETRPEWGLADNAAFIVAPRSRTRGLDLGGRCFLHDYDATADQDGAVLELIMTAPMVVTHWINLQYYASTVDPERFGSGNKVLHNVACGRIGVFEGNTGDLRIGLSRQSLHDGEHWRHTPLRLSVFIDASRDRIDRIIARHGTVRRLVDNRWLHLFRFADIGIERRHAGRWVAWDRGARQDDP
jgi:uncharacterized protein YbcC (UPF0753/DUF2309 family)